jgi:hypothetical protein
LHIGLAAVPSSLESTGGEESGGPDRFTLAHVLSPAAKSEPGASAGKVTISWLLGTLAARPPFA